MRRATLSVVTVSLLSAACGGGASDAPPPGVTVLAGAGGASSQGGASSSPGGAAGMAAAGFPGSGATGGSAGKGAAGGPSGGAAGSPSGKDPCVGSPADGTYCGAALGIKDASTLYTCKGKAATDVKPCPDGCDAAGGGKDVCGMPGLEDPCKSPPTGDGDYCGGSLNPPGNKQTLFSCKAGSTAKTQVCIGGCKQNPPGTNDTCVTTSAVDPCSGAKSGDGSYCGSSLPGGDGKVVYLCAGGVTTSKLDCANGCHVAPAGMSDSCELGSGGDPCKGASSGSGAYCGSTLPGGDTAALYTCQNAATASKTPCSMGCQVNAAGIADACKGAADPCGAAPSGDGDYCGNDGLGADPGTLYHCANKKTASATKCPSGCHVAAAGTNDSCNGAADPCSKAPSAGAFCGGDGLGADANTLFQCAGGKTTSSMTCPAGCHVAAAGTNDSCNAAGGDPCVGAKTGNGPYCGGELPGGDAATLYECTNSATSSSSKCPSGCTIAPAGQSDYCSGGSGSGVSCGAPQWWTASPSYYYALTTHFANTATYWDADFGQYVNAPIQLRHDSKLLGFDPGSCCGYVPTFQDQKTGEIFRFLHLHPQNKNATNVGQVYPAGFIVGISGGNTYDTGLGKSCGSHPCSTGAHLCVETKSAFTTAFPPGKEPCH